MLNKTISEVRIQYFSSFDKLSQLSVKLFASHHSFIYRHSERSEESFLIRSYIYQMFRYRST